MRTGSLPSCRSLGRELRATTCSPSRTTTWRSPSSISMRCALIARSKLANRPARGPELARDRPCRVGDRPGDAPRAAARQQRLGVPHDADGADGVAGVVEDRRGDARLAEHRLVALAGPALLGDLPELLAQRRPGEGAPGQLRRLGG